MGDVYSAVLGHNGYGSVPPTGKAVCQYKACQRGDSMQRVEEMHARRGDQERAHKMQGTLHGRCHAMTD